jgi:hypothetical protein
MTKEQTTEYQKYYRKYYKTQKKKVTVPLDIEEYNKLESFAKKRDITTNKLSKEILENFINSKSEISIPKEQEKLIKEFIRVSRGIATNINQIAYKSNIQDHIDINLLLNSLKKNEDNFKKLVTDLNNDN